MRNEVNMAYLLFNDITLKQIITIALPFVFGICCIVFTQKGYGYRLNKYLDDNNIYPLRGMGYGILFIYVFMGSLIIFSVLTLPIMLISFFGYAIYIIYKYC